MSSTHQRGLYVPSGNNSTFYCGKDGHMKDKCHYCTKHIEKDWIIIDMCGRPTQPDSRMIPFSGGTTTKMRVDSLNSVPRPEKPVASNSQSLIGKPGVIQLSQSIGLFAISDQLEIENELEKFDLNDLV